MFRLPLGQISIAKTKSNLTHMLGNPIYDRLVTAVEVAREQQVPDDENSTLEDMLEIARNGLDIMRNPRDRCCTLVVSEFEIGYVVLGDAIEQIQRCGARVEIGLPNDIGKVVYVLHDLKDSWQMDRRFSPDPLKVFGALGAAPCDGGF